MRTGLESSRLLREIRVLPERVKKDPAVRAGARQQVQANWDRIDPLCNENRGTIHGQYFRRTGLAMRSVNTRVHGEIVSLDWHMASDGGGKRPAVVALFQRLCREYRLLYSNIRLISHADLWLRQFGDKVR